MRDRDWRGRIPAAGGPHTRIGDGQHPRDLSSAGPQPRPAEVKRGCGCGAGTAAGNVPGLPCSALRVVLPAPPHRDATPRHRHDTIRYDPATDLSRFIFFAFRVFFSDFGRDFAAPSAVRTFAANFQTARTFVLSFASPCRKRGAARRFPLTLARCQKIENPSLRRRSLFVMIFLFVLFLLFAASPARQVPAHA